MKLVIAFASILVLISSARLGPESLPVERAYDVLGEGKLDGANGAIALFTRALQADAASPYRWCDLGEAMAEAGQIEKARAMFLRALDLGPNAPPVELRAANFYFGVQDTASALRQTRAILKTIADYDDIIFSSYGRMGVPIQMVLDDGIPKNARAAGSYLRFLIRRERAEEAKPAWEWVSANALADDALSGEYVSLLWRLKDYSEAATVWRKWDGGGEGLSNSGFEREPKPTLFDWHIEKLNGVDIARDEAGPHSGSRCLRIKFPGEENVAFHHVSQKVVVKAGRYNLRAFMRTLEISTDQGVGLRVSDAETDRLLGATAALTGSNGWTEVHAEFSIPAGIHGVDVTLAREPSLRFDNLIRGTVWIDDVGLHLLSGKAVAEPAAGEEQPKAGRQEQ